MNKLNDFEVRELACCACGLSEQQVEDILNKDDGSEEELLFDKYGIDFEQFYNLINSLIRFTPAVRSPLSETNFHSFVHNGRMIVRLKETK